MPWALYIHNIGYNECEANFAKHLKVLKTWYCEPKMLGFHELSSIIPLVFNHW